MVLKCKLILRYPWFCAKFPHSHFNQNNWMKFSTHALKFKFLKIQIKFLHLIKKICLFQSTRQKQKRIFNQLFSKFCKHFHPLTATVRLNFHQTERNANCAFIKISENKYYFCRIEFWSHFHISLDDSFSSILTFCIIVILSLIYKLPSSLSLSFALSSKTPENKINA